jgi:hypothetical protein
LGWSKDPGPPRAEKFSAIFYEGFFMKELSVFVDESGDYGEYRHQAPYYIVTLVFHDQAINITENITTLNKALAHIEVANKAIHTGPIIRRELEYRYVGIDLRKKIFNCLFNFARKIDFSYKTFVVEKNEINDPLALYSQLSKQMAMFLTEHLHVFSEYDRVIIYYDNGQIELTKLLVSVFNSILHNVEFRRVYPSDYKLFQVADLICTLELISIKIEKKSLSRSEINFFTTMKHLKKSFLLPLEKKKFGRK